MSRSVGAVIRIAIVGLVMLSNLPAAAAEGSCRALDGDTFICFGERIRLENIDAPELHARCEKELSAAEAAKRFAQTALDGAGEIQVDVGRRARDRYGRTLARVAIDGRDLGKMLIDAGLARPYHGERRQSWCD